MDAEELFDALSHMPSEIRTTNFWKTVGDLEVRALVIRMHYSQHRRSRKYLATLYARWRLTHWRTRYLIR